MTHEGAHGRHGGEPLVSLLAQAQISRSSVIRVTGANGLSALLWLCRHGFDQVGYVKPGQGCPHEEADAMLIAHTCDAPALRRLLATGPHVREGGVLVFQSPLPTPSQGRAGPIHRVLEENGYQVERCVHGARREVHVARRQATTWRKAA